jgi:non-heme chloroperoxidase
MSFISTPDGVRLRVSDRGEGDQTVVLVHGWKGSHRLWDPAIHRLAERFRVIAFDNRGMGESDKPSGRYDIGVLAEDLDFVLTEFEASDVTLVGWSMGCSIGLEYLGNGGDRAARLALMNGPVKVRSSEDFPFGMENEQVDGYLEGLAAGWPDTELAFAREAQRDPDSAYTDFYYQVAMQMPLEMAMRLVRAQVELDHREILTGLTIPVLGIVGAHDPYYPTALADWIAEHARDGRAEIFTESAHSVHQDEPDRFAEVIAEFTEGRL